MSSRALCLYFFTSICTFLLAPGIVLAVTINLNSAPTQITPIQELEISYSLDCKSCQDSYLRFVFFVKTGDYFGYTLNSNGSWINSSTDKTQYYLLTENQLSQGTYSGVLKAKLDPDSSYYAGSGIYHSKIIRYTASGNKSGESGVVDIQVLAPASVPTSTPVPTLTSVPTLSFSPTPASKPTKTPTPKTPTSVPVIPVTTSTPNPIIPTLVVSHESIIILSETAGATAEPVIAVNDLPKIAAVATPDNGQVKGLSHNKPSALFGIGLMVFGILLIVTSVAVTYMKNVKSSI